MNLCQLDAVTVLLQQLFTTLNDCRMKMAVSFLQEMMQISERETHSEDTASPLNPLKEPPPAIYNQGLGGVDYNTVLSPEDSGMRALWCRLLEESPYIQSLILSTEFHVKSA